MVKVKERLIKAAREKKIVMCKRKNTMLSADFSAETLQVKEEWQNIFKVERKKTSKQEFSIQ